MNNLVRFSKSAIVGACASPFALAASPLFAEEKTAGELANTSSEVATGLIKTIKAATSGEEGAVQRLASDYLLPAIAVLGVLFIGYMFASFIGRRIGAVIAKRVDLTLGKFLSKAIRNGLMFVLLLGVLNHFDVNVTAFAAMIAALGFAFGMALQGTLSNFAAGIMLLVFRPFKVGDYIQCNGEEGCVDEIDLFATRLNTLDNLHKIVPNGQIFGATITNFSHNDVRRVEVSVGAEYGADIDRTRAVLQAAISEIPGTVADPAPQVVMIDLGDSSVNWQVRAWCDPADYWAVKEMLTMAAKKGMDLNGIGIPFPQMELHLPDNAAVAGKINLGESRDEQRRAA